MKSSYRAYRKGSRRLFSMTMSKKEIITTLPLKVDQPAESLHLLGMEWTSRMPPTSHTILAVLAPGLWPPYRRVYMSSPFEAHLHLGTLCYLTALPRPLSL